MAINQDTPDVHTPELTSVVRTCSGCGAPLQSEDPKKLGFIPETKLAAIQRDLQNDQTPKEDGSLSDQTTSDEGGDSKTSSLVICQRCFSLKHYNTALNVTLKADDYLHHLGHLREKKALILLMIDVADFPGSLFPHLNTLIPQTSPVMIVANKVDLLPSQSQLLERYERMIVDEGLQSSLAGCRIAGVHFISAKSGKGVEELTEAILQYWGNRGDVYLLGCTNVGKSTLFNKLLITLCGARPGDLTTVSNVSAPAPTISQWPGTTLGLLSFPIMSLGKRRRLLAQFRRREMAAARSAVEEEDFQFYDDDPEHSDVGLDDSGDGVLTPEQARQMSRAQQETEEVLREIGIRRCQKEPIKEAIKHDRPPQNRFWLHDTPGAINDAQVGCGW